MQGKRNLRHLFWNSANNQALGTSLLKDPRWQHINAAEKAQIFTILPPLSGLRVLELGGGIGRFTTDFARQARSVTVVELSEQALQENRERHRDYTNITYIARSLTDVQFAPASFDLIFSNWLLMYLSEAEIAALLTACRTWLAPGGRLFFRESCERNHAGHRVIRGVFSAETIRMVLPFVGRPIFSIWKLKVPSLMDMWQAARHCEKLQHFRKAQVYEQCFSGQFRIVNAGSITVYEEEFRNKWQRYWLLA